MRRVLLTAAVLLAAAAPSRAQTPSPLGPHTVLPAHILCAELPATAPPAVTLTIAGANRPDGRTALVKGDSVVINAGTADGLAVGQRYVARRLGMPARFFPKRGEGYGAIRTTGVIAVTAANETMAIGEVEFACDAVGPGDRLTPYEAPVVPAPAEAGDPQFEDRAHVLFGSDTRSTVGDGEIFSIDRGSAHGVTPGARVAIYRDPGQRAMTDAAAYGGPQPCLPLAYLGEAVVLEVQDTTAKVILVTTRDAVGTGDIAVLRRPAGRAEGGPSSPASPAPPSPPQTPSPSAAAGSSRAGSGGNNPCPTTGR